LSKAMIRLSVVHHEEMTEFNGSGDYGRLGGALNGEGARKRTPCHEDDRITG
jgi:hypothetical protein